MRSRICGLWLVLLLTTQSFAMPARAETPCAAPATMMDRVELYFGVSRGATQRAFAHFLAREVTPRFPDGLSLFRGYGQWRDSGGHISAESAQLLVIFYRPDPKANDKIEAIRAAYKKRFHQQSVLRADSQACVSF